MFGCKRYGNWMLLSYFKLLKLKANEKKIEKWTLGNLNMANSCSLFLTTEQNKDDKYKILQYLLTFMKCSLNMSILRNKHIN